MVNISDNHIYFDYTGGTQTVSVSTDSWQDDDSLSWDTVETSGKDWVDISLSDTFSETITATISVSRYDDETDRNATVEFSYGNSMGYLNVTQYARTYNYEVYPSVHSFSSNGGNATCLLTTDNSGKSWSSSETESWISSTISNNTLSISVSKNNTTSDRDGFVNVYYGDNLVGSVQILQEGLAYTYSSNLSQDTFSSDISAAVINHTTTDNRGYWEASTSDSWIKISDMTFSMSYNNKPYSRSGEITVEYIVDGVAVYSETYSILQYGVNATYSVSPESMSFNSSSGSKSVTCNTNDDRGTWVVNTSANWVNADETSISVSENTSTSSRSVNVYYDYMVNGNSLYSDYISITQNGKSFYYDVEQTTITTNCFSKSENISLSTDDDRGYWEAVSDASWATTSIASPGKSDTTLTINLSRSYSETTRTANIDVYYYDIYVDTITVTQTGYIYREDIVYMSGGNKLATRGEFNEQMKSNHFNSSLSKAITYGELQNISWYENEYDYNLYVNGNYSDDKCVICDDIYKKGIYEDY